MSDPADQAASTWPLGLGQRDLRPNLYDLVVFILIAGAFVALAHGLREMGAPIAKLEVAPVTYIASANNITDNINATTSLQNPGSLLATRGTGSIYAGAPRPFVGGMRLAFR
jgi:hypothetical protein